ncbi:MAG: high-affinity branched-chain amino acid ABC transporter permease LivH [Burkholderiales bacterium]|jgi:branched-chain amino acid transport system permease protein|nr:high-affinity branched-chain amino acid ABC transporter permease LivH [Burkholderiales bacterium]
MDAFLPQLLQQLINGLSLGAIYALIAIGYTMVYGIIGMINFAHGEIYMIGAYIGLITMTAIGAAAGYPPWLLVVAALVVAAVVTSTYGWAVERCAYRSLRSSPRLVPLISAIGMSIFFQNYVVVLQSSRDLSVPELITGRLFSIDMAGFEVSMSNSRALILVATVVLMVAVTLYIRHTRMGRACRACSQDIRMAGLLGIDVNKVISFTFILGAFLASVGGVLIGLSINKINPFIGFLAGIKAFTAAVLGGIGSVPGAMLGGALLGLVETFASAFLPTEYKDMVAFGLLIVILLIRPSGLLGRPEVEKV